MADTATSRNRLRKPESGQYVNAWAPELNEDFGSDRLDQALDGRCTFTLSASKTLTSTNYETDEARMRFFDITSGTGGTVTAPSVEKWGIVRNATSGDVVWSTGGATTATIKSGNVEITVSDGTSSYLVRTLDYGSSLLKTTGTPSLAAHLTNKTYVDAAILAAAFPTSSFPLAAGIAAWLADPTSAKLAAALTDDTGSGALNFGAPVWTQIGSTQTPSGVASSSITGIDQTYQDIYIELLGLSHTDGSNQALRVELSGDNGSTWSTALAISSTFAASATCYGGLDIPKYRSDGGRAISAVGNLGSDLTTASSGISMSWRIAGGVDAIRLSFAAGNFDAGSWKLWGK